MAELGEGEPWSQAGRGAMESATRGRYFEEFTVGERTLFVSRKPAQT